MDQKKNFTEGEYYVIKLTHDSINDYPEFVKKYTSNLVVYYKKNYKLPIRSVRTFVFEHTVPLGHYMLTGALTSSCRSYIKQPIFTIWESHIFEDRFDKMKPLNNILINLVRKWKKVTNKKKMCIYLCMKNQGLPGDLCESIFKTYYNR
jgi:hypothetical protein